jgi:hypothetical protein
VFLPVREGFMEMEVNSENLSPMGMGRYSQEWLDILRHEVRRGLRRMEKVKSLPRLARNGQASHGYAIDRSMSGGANA